MKIGKEKDNRIQKLIEDIVGIKLLNFNKQKELENHNRHRSTQIQNSEGLIFFITSI